MAPEERTLAYPEVLERVMAEQSPVERRRLYNGFLQSVVFHVTTVAERNETEAQEGEHQ